MHWICVKSDDQKNRLEKNRELNGLLRGILEEWDYPAEARSHVGIGFESQETVDRESHGHWWHHWK